MMLWIRALLFTLVVPGTVLVWIPSALRAGGLSSSPWAMLGWLPVAIGIMFYAISLLKFMATGGTPMIYFARFLGFALGEEPPALVERGLYRYTRNPMYVGGILAVFGQAVLFASWPVALYGLFLIVWFHFLVVTRLEEPHLRRQFGPAYEVYCQRVPRWL